MRSRRLLRAAFMAVAICGWMAFETATDSIGVFVSAQMASYYAFEQVTVDNTAGGKALTSSKITPSGQPMATSASCRLETAEIRYTIDGTAPTTTVGTLLEPGDTLVISGHDVLVTFRAIRTGASSGIFDCNYFGG